MRTAPERDRLRVTLTRRFTGEPDCAIPLMGCLTEASFFAEAMASDLDTDPAETTVSEERCHGDVEDAARLPSQTRDRSGPASGHEEDEKGDTRMNSEAKPSAPGTPPAEDPANAQDRESQPAPPERDGSGQDAPEQDAPEHDAVYYGEDALADEWGDESFPASDPPAHY